ncbi:AAA family ATPase [bacterium]|nr:AAA family ATPase [bacterium]
MKKIDAKEFLKQTDETVFTTGFSEIDEFIKNVDKGSILTIGARPSMGKTFFAISILTHLLEENKKVCWFSPSLPMNNVIKRLAAHKLEIMPFQLDRNPELKKKISDAVEYFAQKDLFIDDSSLLTIENIEEEIKTEAPDVVFIDYLQLLKMPKAPNFTDSINLAVQEIHRIAKETGVIFIILSQLSRALESRLDKRPMLFDIRSSSMLEELSDVVMMLYRDEYYNHDDESNKGLAEVIFCKNEFGPTGLVHLLFNRIKFKDYTYENFKDN